MSKKLVAAESTALGQINQPNLNLMTTHAAQKTYEEAKALCKEKKYEEALVKISEIEERFPSSSKAICFLKGHARVELLKERNELPQLTHMKH